MWEKLVKNDKEEYESMILALASLSDIFSQKSSSTDINTIVAPVVNYKYQETVFQRIFKAQLQDKDNTPFDVSLASYNEEGLERLYLIGIKTFGAKSKFQKVAQFKSNHDKFVNILNEIHNNSRQCKNVSELNKKNKKLYFDLVKLITSIRNSSIQSAKNTISGFYGDITDSTEQVYHVLITSERNAQPKIMVGETNYDEIVFNSISKIECTSVKNPSNIVFSDGKHKYKFTSSDCQLWMEFDKDKIVLNEWPVEYVEDAYQVFRDISQLCKKPRCEYDIVDYQDFPINIKANPFSAFNAFYGLSPKNATQYERDLKKIKANFSGVLSQYHLNKVVRLLKEFRANISSEDKLSIRNKIVLLVNKLGNLELKEHVLSMVYRPKNELYIPLEGSRNFHYTHKDFFNTSFGKHLDKLGSGKIIISRVPKVDRSFKLVIDRCNQEIDCFLSQDDGKGIQSLNRQEELGEWILKRLFLLHDYEQLTEDHIQNLQINTIRLTKTRDNKIHLNFIWSDDINPKMNRKQ